MTQVVSSHFDCFSDHHGLVWNKIVLDDTVVIFSNEHILLELSTMANFIHCWTRKSRLSHQKQKRIVHRVLDEFLPYIGISDRAMSCGVPSTSDEISMF